MKSVLHVVVAGEVGGAERMLVDLARTSDRPHAIALISPNDDLRRLFVEAGLDVDVHPRARREGPLGDLARTFGRTDVAWLDAQIRRRGASIVHLHTFGSQVVGTRAARRSGARVLRTEHSTRVYDDPSCLPFSLWSLAYADLAACVSHHVRDVACRRAPWAARKLRVVPNGIDLTRFSAIPFPDVSAGGPVRLLSLGRLDRRKGVDLALRALAHVPNAHLDIVGDGVEGPRLRSLTRRLGLEPRVTFHGYASDVTDALARCHAVVSSARKEGLGIALLEAMAIGRPVVACPTGGVPEFVHDGLTGWLADRRSPHALARVLRSAVRDPHELAQRGLRARELVRERFTLPIMRAGYEGLYRELMELEGA